MVVKETEYKGILFRSRLEAKVAFFFDKAGIEWVYEPDRVVNGDSEYNPDFYLPELDDYVEVKGKRPGYEKEILKAREHLTWGGDIKRLVIISEIPDPTAPGLPHFPCYYYDASIGGDCIETGWFYFCDKMNEKKATGDISSSNYYHPAIELDNVPPTAPFLEDFNINPKTDYELNEAKGRVERTEYYTKQVKEFNPITFKAYAAARKADFTMRRAG